MKPIETAITRIFAADGSIVGLGFLITESRIMTCAHVVADAVGIQRDDANPPAQPISVDFPLVDGNKKCTSRVVVWLPSRDGTDDIAVLELREAAPTSAKPANLVTVDKLWGAEFGVYGFPRYNPKGVWAKGKVSGLIEGKRIQIDALEGNTSYFIEPGFSGSPVYSNDPNINGVIGIAVSAESDPNIKAGFMIPSDVLLTKMNQRQPLPTDDGQTSPLRTPINMTDGKPQPLPHIWKRKMQRRVVYIGKFEEMQPVYQSKRVFVAHHFFGGDTNEMQDYRVFLKDGLEQIGYLPLFARDDSGTLLETICQDIINTEAGIYDVSGYNANVLIELGMSIGLNQPTIVIAQDDRKPLIDPLQQLNPLRYADRYDLAEGIGQAVKEHIQKYHQLGMSPRFCAACGLDCIARKPRQSPEDEYLLVGADPDKDRAIFFHLKKAVKNFNLSWHELEGDFNLTVCQWVEEIKRSKLVFFHSKENGDKRHSGSDNASTMVRTGIAIGLGIAWRMILKQGERMPTDLEGYKYVTWQSSATAFDATLGGAVRTLLSEARPYGGMYDPLIPVEAVEDEEQPLTLVDSPQQILSSVFIGYASGDGVGKKLAQDIQAVANTLQIETFISLNRKETIDRYGDNWRETIIPDLDVAMFIISDNSPTSRSIALELKIALSSNIPTYFIMGPDTPIDLLQRLSDSDNDLNKIPVVRLEANEEQAIEEQIKSSLLSILSDQPKSFPTLAEVVRTATSQNNYVYISASRKEAEFVEQLLSDLIKNHIRVWVDKNIPGGTEWQKTIERGIRDCAVAIIVISESSSNSKFVQEEINLLLELGKPIIPILIGSPRDIPQQLLKLHYADFTSDYNYGLPRLIEGIQHYLPNQGAKSAVRAENKHIFIAYVRQDASDFSRRLAENLGRADFTAFNDLDSLVPGVEWAKRLREEVERSDIVLCIMSPNALRSEWWIREIAWAFEMNKLIIPILLDGETMPRPGSLPGKIKQLSHLGAVMFRSQEFERDFERLVQSLNKINSPLEYENDLSLIGDRAEEIYRRLPSTDDVKADQMQRVFSVLVNVDEHGTATRRRYLLERFNKEDLVMVRAFIDARLLVTGNGGGEATYVEVAHESLFRAWERLKDWITAAQEDLILLRQIRRDADEWQTKGRPDYLLWHQERIDLVHAMLERLSPQLSEVEADFIESEQSRLLRELGDSNTDDQRRRMVRERLAVIGDSQSGIGLQQYGLPQIDWVSIPSSKIQFEGKPFDIQSFFVSKYPITYRQFQAFVDAPDGYADSRWWDGFPSEAIQQTMSTTLVASDNYPRDSVSWYQCIAFIRWLNAKYHEIGLFGQFGSGQRVINLPTEQQWQYTAQSADGRAYPWGNLWDCECCNNSVQPCNSNSAKPVQQYEGKGNSPFGVVDMAGNVWEWCLTDYDTGSTNLIASERRVIRGGSWGDNEASLFRCDYRNGQAPTSRSNRIGFRIVAL